MNKYLTILISMGLLLVAGGQAQAQLGYFCINGNSYQNYTQDGVVHDHTEPCPHGCDQSTGQCAAKVETGMSIQFFLIILAVSGGFLYGGIRYKKWLLCMGSTVFFLVLAFQGFRILIVTGGVTIVFQEIIVVILMWMGAIVAFIFTLLGMVKAAQDSMNVKKQKKLMKNYNPYREAG